MGSPRVRRDPATATETARPAAKKGYDAKGSARVTTLSRWARTRRSNGLARSDADAVGAPASKRVLRSQGRRTMRKLLDAAMVAFDKRGYHATRVNDVVEIAKTSHGTFYLYFSNKEDLLRALVTEAAGESQKLYDALSMLPAQGGAPQWEDVHGWIRAYSELWTRYAPLFRAWTDLATIDPELIDVIRHTFTCISERPVQADRTRLLGPHHRPRCSRPGHARHARPLPLPPRVRRTTDRRRRPRDDDDDGLPGALDPNA